MLNLGIDLEKAVNLFSEIGLSKVDYNLDRFLTKNGNDLEELSQVFFQNREDYQLTIDQEAGRYSTLTDLDIRIITQATRIVTSKIHSETRLAFQNNPKNYTPKWTDTSTLEEGRIERLDFDQDEVIANSPRIQAAKIELNNLFQEALKPAREILSTRYRAHGGKKNFTCLEEALDNLKAEKGTEEEAKAIFRHFIDQVENSFNAFARLLVFPPELLALKAELKTLVLQDHDFNDGSVEEYLQLD